MTTHLFLSHVVMEHTAMTGWCVDGTGFVPLSDVLVRNLEEADDRQALQCVARAFSVELKELGGTRRERPSAWRIGVLPQLSQRHPECNSNGVRPSAATVTTRASGVSAAAAASWAPSVILMTWVLSCLSGTPSVILMV